MNPPWNDWYHCNGNTYGTWLRGDSRGFRERHGRKEVKGDYKNPPLPGTYDAVLACSRSFLKHAPVYLNIEQQQLAADALVEKLSSDRIELIALAVDTHHFHLLARFSDHRPRHWIGRAKKHASEVLSGRGLKGQVWATRCRCLPILDRSHQLNTFRYITEHGFHGASICTFRNPIPVVSPRPEGGV